MPGGFHRVNPLGDGFIRGPARLLVEPVTAVYPSKLSDIINLATTGYTTEVQTLTVTGTPTGGTFTLTFNGQTTTPIAFNATSAQIVTALTALAAIGPNGVTASGGPSPTTPVVITFAGPNASLAMPLITGNATGLTGGTTPAVSIVRTTAGFGLYDPVGAWTELGSTKTGVQIGRNNTEENLDVDQILAQIATIPNDWEKTVTTAFAETTLENIQNAWEGGAITTDITTTPNERHLPLGAPLSYTQRRLAVVHQKTLGTSAGKIRAHVLRIVTRSPQNSVLTFNKAGEQATVPHVFRALADSAVADPNARFGEIIEQLAA